MASLRTGDSGRLGAAGTAMHKVLAHRGPDHAQVWVEGEGNLMLAHRRLAVVDLSADGRQPMESASQRYVIVYNGEIYNYPDLQQDLISIGHDFKGRSDTEVLLAAIDHWGLNQTLQKINGQFAFALWDKKEKHLHLVRDRFGKKPLYVGWAGQDLVFASELKAFHVLPGYLPALNPDALALYMRYGYVCAPYSIFSSVWQLLPGSRLRMDVSRLTPGEDLSARMEKYWSLTRSVEEARAHPFEGDEHEQQMMFEQLLDKAVAQRMISDVPLGAFLSGGVDSASVVALMQRHSAAPVKTFSIAFDHPAYNEGPQAAAIAAHLGTEHETIALGQKDAQRIIPGLPDIFDEPFADPSAIPAYAISRAARREVTVALSGDGGDELLGGYDRHIHLPPLWEKIGWMPSAARRPLAALLGRLPPSLWHKFYDDPQIMRKVGRLISVMHQSDRRTLYDGLLAGWDDNIVFDAAVPDVPVRRAGAYPRGLSFADYMMFGDMLSYRPDNLMVKADRAGMAAGLEARAPLMDYRLSEFCWRLPPSAKIRGGEGKWLLRRVLEKYVPASLIAGPKKGFSVPVGEWLQGDLQGWANDLLSPARLRRQGLLDDKAVGAAWQACLQGKTPGTDARKIWTVLMLQGWMDRWMTKGN